MFRSFVRFSLVFCLFVGLIRPPASLAQEKPDVRYQIADVYGLGSWSNVDQIRYTFNFEAGPKKAARTWTWEIKTDKVTFEGTDPAGKPVKVSYARASMSPDVVKGVDPNFINDQYWTLFPFHLVWDTDVTVEDKGMAADPTGKTKGKVRKVTVTYPKTGGYTPGDMYDLFVGPDQSHPYFLNGRSREAGRRKRLRPGEIVAANQSQMGWQGITAYWRENCLAVETRQA